MFLFLCEIRHIHPAPTICAESSDMIPAKKNIKSRSLEKVIVGYLPPFLHYRKDEQVSEGQKERYSVIDFCSKMIDNGLDS